MDQQCVVESNPIYEVFVILNGMSYEGAEWRWATWATVVGSTRYDGAAQEGMESV